MTVWFTSDLHLRHTNQAIRRGFAEVDEHDEIHVGVDAHDLSPVSLHWIENIIKESE